MKTLVGRLSFYYKYRDRAYFNKHGYVIKGKPNKKRSQYRYQWQDWYLTLGKKKLGKFLTLEDAKLFAYTYHEQRTK